MEDLLRCFYFVASNTEAVANVLLIFVCIKILYSQTKIRLRFSFGEVKMKKADVNVSNLTNIVSKEFCGGGRLSDEMRKEVIKATLPKYRVSRY